MTRSALVFATLIVSTSFATAQGSGTPEDKAACQSSVKQYCTSSIQGGDMAVLACLQQNRSRIAPACQQVLVKYGQ
jgi:hypothetical protein